VKCKALKRKLRAEPLAPQAFASFERQHQCSSPGFRANSIAATVTGCHKPVLPTSQARPVRTVAVERRAEGESVFADGHVRAKGQASLAFPLDGRMIERLVNIRD
jgi:hypothetical protein